MTITHRTAGSVAVVPTEATLEMVEWSSDVVFSGDEVEDLAAIHRAHVLGSPSEPAADLEALVRALRECADDLAAEIDARNQGDTRKYPSMEAKYQRDMEPVHRARAALANWTETNDG